VNKIKVIRLIIFWVLICLTASKAYAEDVAIIVYGNFKAYTFALEGFKNTCHFSVKEYSIGDVDKEERVLSEIAAENPKLIFVIGSKIAEAVKERFSNIPIVFALVTNPAQYKLTGSNICGVRLDVSPKLQLSFLKRIAPLVKNVGVIYDPKRTQEIIDEAKGYGTELGINLIDYKAESKADVSQALNELEKKIDAFWIITDPIVANSVVFEKLLLLSLIRRIPLICPARAFVEKGGCFSLDVDYQDLGAQAADIANLILSGHKKPKDIGVEFPRKVNLILNSNIASKINLSLPQEIIKEATEIISKE